MRDRVIEGFALTCIPIHRLYTFLNSESCNTDGMEGEEERD